MNITELAMLKKIVGNSGGSGDATVLLHERQMTFAANGTHEITPNEGYDGLSRVGITVDVPAFYNLDLVGNLNSYFETQLDKRNVYRARPGLYTHVRINESVYLPMGGNTYIVDELPEIGEPLSIDGETPNVVYYNRADETVYGYITDEMASALAMSAGWYDVGTFLQLLNFSYGGVVTNFENMTDNETVYFIANTLYLVYSDDAWAWYAPSVDDDNSGGVDKIQRWIELQGNSSKYMFYNFSGTSVDEIMEGADTSGATDMQYMFSSATKLTSVPLFDTSNVTDMYYMFNSCSALTTVPLFNTSKVNKMASMFRSCSKLTSVPLFDTSNVTSMDGMFYYCGSLTTVPAFDLRNSDDLYNMFFYCSKLTEIWVRNIKKNLQVSDGSFWGTLITRESLLNLCKECRNVNVSRTLTMGSNNLNKLNGIYVKLIDITDEMRAEDDLIDEKYPFVQCESTDADAMTIQDYMALKMWTLA